MMFTTAFGILSVLSGLFTAASAGPPKMPKKVHGLPQEIWCPRWGNQRQVAFSSRDFTKTILANVKLVVNQEMQEGGYPQVLDAADMALFEVPNEILQAHRDIFWAPLTTGADYIVYVLFAYDARGTATYVGASICAPDDGVGPNDPYREKCHFCRPSNQQSA